MSITHAFRLISPSLLLSKWKDELYSTTDGIKNWEYITSFYGKSIPQDGILQARSAPRRFNTTFVSLQTKQRICQLSALDYCCLNLNITFLRTLLYKNNAYQPVTVLFLHPERVKNRYKNKPLIIT